MLNILVLCFNKLVSRTLVLKIDKFDSTSTSLLLYLQEMLVKAFESENTFILPSYSEYCGYRNTKRSPLILLMYYTT